MQNEREPPNHFHVRRRGMGNVLLSEQARARAVLAELHRQAGELLNESSEGRTIANIQGPLELLVMFDPTRAGEEAVREAVAECIPAESAAIRWQLVAAPEASYYTMKNLGALQTSGEIVVLLDSDVIPEEGWLLALVNSLADERVQVVGGNTYVKPISFYTRTMALTWFFPLRAATPLLRTTQAFYANNVAFRRRTLLAFPFPDSEEQSRGACEQVARRMIAAGIQPYLNTAAQVEHPPPNGLAHFLLRGAAEGRDQLLDCRQHRDPGKASLLRSLFRALKRWSRAVRRLVRYRKAWASVGP
jgi:hypothetical protein